MLIGATIVASRAGEMSGELSLAIAKGLSVGDVATAVHAYPTYTTALQQMTSQVATATMDVEHGRPSHRAPDGIRAIR